MGWDFPGSPVVKNPPCTVEDVGLIPGQGTMIPHTVELLSPYTPTKIQLRPNAIKLKEKTWLGPPHRSDTGGPVGSSPVGEATPAQSRARGQRKAQEGRRDDGHCRESYTFSYSG